MPLFSSDMTLVTKGPKMLVNKSLMVPLIVEKVREEHPRMLGVHQEMAVEKKLYQNEL